MAYQSLTLSTTGSARESGRRLGTRGAGWKRHFNQLMIVFFLRDLAWWSLYRHRRLDAG